jgi:hypothetical protein
MLVSTIILLVAAMFPAGEIKNQPAIQSAFEKDNSGAEPTSPDAV